ncbi:minor pilin of type IV secretion complex [Vibrio astriarenae]|nr:minor pilin of type IV secretion complex [Vibrio sp. C7]
MLKDYAVLLEQIDEMKRQFEQMEKDYEAVTGSRNLGRFLTTLSTNSTSLITGKTFTLI